MLQPHWPFEVLFFERNEQGLWACIGLRFNN